MDIVKQRRIREWSLLTLVGLMALVANLPVELLDRIGVERGVIMAVLGMVVILALFLYVRFFFFLLYTLLALGANLPERWADALQISQGPLLMTLISMVAISLLNYAIKLLPSGLEPKSKKVNPEAVQVLLNGIERGNPGYVRSVLSMDFEVNLLGTTGLSPLMRAAQRGDDVMVDLLLRFGAAPDFGNGTDTPASLARAAGHEALAQRLEDYAVAQPKASVEPPEPAAIVA